MDTKFMAIVAKAQDKGEFDKLLRLITPQGVISATARGIKRPKAKLKAMAVPFAFCEFSAAKKGSSFIITGASVVEDLFDICLDHDKLVAGGIILEAALACFGEDSEEKFIYMLYRFKDIIYKGLNPYIQAIMFLQNMIHSCGYGYDYQRYDVIEKPIQLLSFLYFYPDRLMDIKVEISLIKKTLIKLIESFESKLDAAIQSKKMLI